MSRLQTLRKQAIDLRAQMRARLDAMVHPEGHANAGEARAPDEAEQAVHDTDLASLTALTEAITSEERLATLKPSADTTDTVLDLGDTTDTVDARVTHEPGDDDFPDFGTQLQAIVRACNPSDRVVDDRQVRIDRESRAASGLSETVPSDGGFQLQKDFITEIKSRMVDQGQILSRVTKTPISAISTGLKFNVIKENSRKNGSRGGGVQAYWTDEAESFTKSKPKMRQVELTVSKLTGLMYTTGELLADAPALTVRAMRDFPNELTFKVEDAIFEGDGVGKPLGVKGHNGTVVVAIQGGQAADTIVHENITDMWSRMRNRSGAVWMINQDIEPQLNTMTISVGTGGSVSYLPAGGLSQAPFSTLMGAPVIPIEFASTLGDEGDIMLCDWAAYEFIDKGTPQSDTSIHVRFLFDEEVFRIIYRLDGQPLHNSKLTPYKGTVTQGHFVTLAERA